MDMTMFEYIERNPEIASFFFKTAYLDKSFDKDYSSILKNRKIIGKILRFGNENKLESFDKNFYLLIEKILSDSIRNYPNLILTQVFSSIFCIKLIYNPEINFLTKCYLFDDNHSYYCPFNENMNIKYINDGLVLKKFKDMRKTTKNMFAVYELLGDENNYLIDNKFVCNKIENIKLKCIIIYRENVDFDEILDFLRGEIFEIKRDYSNLSPPRTIKKSINKIID